jgi:glycosyltransferase involved in cell wall biosynthesis
MALLAALAKVRDAPFLLDAIRAADGLTAAAGQDGGPHAVKVLTRVVDDLVEGRDDDQVIAIAAVHALGAVFDDGAAAALSDLLSDARPFLREHAAWAMGSRTPRLDAIGRLVSGVAAGGFSTVINQRALRRWAQTAPDHIALAIEGALLSRDDADGRARLVETMGLVPGAVADRTLHRVAADSTEPIRSRMAAIAALGDRSAHHDGAALIRRLATSTGDVAAVARLAAFDIARPPIGDVDRQSGLVVAQLFLHADLDRELSRAGAGDNGGIATMLVRLGDALATQPGVSRVVTMSRGSVQAAVDALTDPPADHVLAPIPLMSEPTDAASAWPTMVAAERGIRRALTAHRVDVLHLRMADVGSMAAAAVATQLGIPTVFTLAPDPHAVIHALDMTGALTRGTFGAADEREHYWFRTGLVRRLADGAHHNVLFPRPKLRDQLRDLLGVDIGADRSRYTVVPEGIDVSVATAAHRDVLAVRGIGNGGAPAARAHPALADLEALVAALPPARHGLPIALSVGRLHRVKGMATVVEAWATSPALRDRCNLLIVGGDLAEPSVDELGQLAAIAAVVAENPSAAAGLMLPGHRPNDVVARWMAAAHLGLGDLVAPGGVYVCGSLKEEFGLALIEALAAGLVVIAPDGGGPATYIDEGVTGFLVDTRSPLAVGAGMTAAFELLRAPGESDRVALAQDLVADRFTIEAMAGTLADVYAGVTAPAAGVAAS